MKHPVILLYIAIFLTGCQNAGGNDVRTAVNSQLSLYPELHLQDLYKAFFQAEFGAEHIVSDTTSAGRYLDMELGVPDHSAVLYEPIGTDSTFYRVHLRAVQEGYISRNQLFSAFVGGVHPVEIPQIEKWNKTWPHIDAVIDRMNLNLPDYDREKAAIDSLLATGSYAIHHSEEFSDKYDPHYRIVRKDLFEEVLLPLLLQ